MLSAPRRGHRRERAARCAFGFDAGSVRWQTPAMAKVAIIGAGSVEFTRNILTDLVQRPRAARHARARAARHRRGTAHLRGAHREPGGRAARRRPHASARTPTGARRSTAPTTWSTRSRSAGTTRRVTRLRDPDALRPAPDDRRHDRDRRDHARPPHDPGDDRDGQRDGRACAPTGSCSTTRTRWRWCRGGSGPARDWPAAARSACATASATRTRFLAELVGVPEEQVEFRTAGFNHQCFVYVFRDRETRRRPLPTAARRSSRPTPRGSAGACASRSSGGSATSPPRAPSTRASTCRGSCTTPTRWSGSAARSTSTSVAATRTSRNGRR